MMYTFLHYGYIVLFLHALTLKIIILHAQTLYTIIGPHGNCGCKGGLVDQAFEYIIKNRGIASGTFYPYWAHVSHWTSLT